MWVALKVRDVNTVVMQPSHGVRSAERFLPGATLLYSGTMTTILGVYAVLIATKDALGVTLPPRYD